MPPRVTALLPAYQAAEFIQATLDSLSALECERLAVFVSVDVCDDDTAQICLDHARKDTRFRVWCQQERQGYVGNCNFLLRQAESEYVFFAFHDDLLHPQYVTKLVALLDAQADAVMAYSDLALTHADGRYEELQFTALDGMVDPVERGKAMLAPVRLWWVPNRGVFRLALARRIGGLKTHGAGEFSADWPWLFHMSLLGHFVRCPEMLCYKFYKPGSLSRTWDFSKRQHYEVGLSCLRELRNSDLSVGGKLRAAVPLFRRLVRMRLGMVRKGLRMRLKSLRGSA